MTSVAIHGAAGRMGMRLVDLCLQHPELTLVAALERTGHPRLGQDAAELAGAPKANVPITDQLPAPADVVIDFSSPAGTNSVLRICAQASTPLVIGTTGLTDQDDQAINQAAKKIPVLQAPNMSLGVNLLMALSATCAQRLNDEYDIEITEAHHRFKKDAPSGTALGLAQAICQANGKSLTNDVANGWYDHQPPNSARPAGKIGIHALRMGDVVGEHTVCFGTLGERIELKHVATDRDIFARGALTAAAWLVGRPPGRYGMADVLGL